MLSKVLILLIFTLCVLWNTVSCKMDTILLSKISCEQEYETGVDVRLTITLMNASAADYWILKWNTPLEGLQSNLLAVTRDGVKIPYDGIMIKRGNPIDEDYALLRAGEAVSETLRLCDAYDLSQPGRYKVSVDTFVLDYYQDQPGTTFKARSTDDHEMMLLQSDPVSFLVRKGNTSCQTIGARHRVVR